MEVSRKHRISNAGQSTMKRQILRLLKSAKLQTSINTLPHFVEGVASEYNAILNLYFKFGLIFNLCKLMSKRCREKTDVIFL